MNHFASTPSAAIQPDPRLAARINPVYNMELARVVTYTYQHLLTEGLDAEASELFADLAAEDMAHFHTLGRLIRALGGDPAVRTRMQTPRIDLSSDASCRALPVVRRMLREDMQAEAAMITELESLSAAAGEESVRAILREIITEEQTQYQRLEALARSF